MITNNPALAKLYTMLGLSSTEPTPMPEETIPVPEGLTPPGTPSVAMSEPRPERSLLERAGKYVPPELREIGRSIGETYLGQEFQDRPIQTTLEMVGPGADINVMKEASAGVIPKLMEGDILGSITELSIATVSPFLATLPFVSMGGIRKVINKEKPTFTESKAIDEIGEATQTIKTGNIAPPKNTTKAYKLFNIDETGNLRPLYIEHGKGAPLPLNKWIKAEAGKINPETGKVVGKGIKDLAYRPGFHSGNFPMATHIGGKIDPKTGKRIKGKQPVNIREDNQVWAEVEVGNDVDWQSVANSRASVVKSGPNKGKLNTQQAQIQDQIPEGGHYSYKTNPNMTGNWLISGEVKINKVLNDAEVKQINDAAGVADLPRISEFLKQPSPTIRKTRTRPQDRDYSTTRLSDKLSDNKTIQFLENNGYTEYTPGLSTNKADTWEYTDKGIRAYSSWVGPGGTEGISQRTFNNPTLKSIRSWMGYKQGGSIVERNPYTHNMKAI